MITAHFCQKLNTIGKNKVFWIIHCNNKKKLYLLKRCIFCNFPSIMVIFISSTCKLSEINSPSLAALLNYKRPLHQQVGCLELIGCFEEWLRRRWWISNVRKITRPFWINVRPSEQEPWQGFGYLTSGHHLTYQDHIYLPPGPWFRLS